MIEPVTLVDLLRSRAARHPERTAFTFLLDGEREGESLTYAALEEEARRLGALLLEQGLRGERVLLPFHPGLSFVAAYFGCLYAGAVGVPVVPPRRDRTFGRLAAIAADADARAVLSTDEVVAELAPHRDDAPQLRGLRWLSTRAAADASAWRDPGIGPRDLAFLQYTSGSTASPRGVRVTHANLLANQRMLREAFGHSEGLVVAGWLPVYHDMGLIGNVLHPLYMGGRCVLMSPAAFLQRPVRWLDAVSRYGAETSGGPNFAYDLCVDRVTEEERATLDLSRWRVAFCGAEPVRARTIQRFAEAFAPAGFRRSAVYPCYGLAEATLFVTGGRAGRPAVVRAFQAAALERGRGVAVPADGAGAAPLVGCGFPWPGSRVEVVRAEEGTVCAPGEVGEVWVAGPHVAGGYWGRPEESEGTFAAWLADGEGPFLRTGDLGFLDGGELFVTGRVKDLIILRGRNLYPQDVEATAGASHPALQPGGGAAFSVEVDGEERLVVVHEVRRTALRSLDTDEVARRIREEVAAAHEAQVHAVVLIRPSTLPKTSSGKVQRHACRRDYLCGALDPVGSSVLAAPGAAPAGAEAPRVAGDVTEALLRAEAARVLHLDPAAVDAALPLAALGLDSLTAAHLAARLEEALGVAPDPSWLLEPCTVAELADRLSARAGLAERDAPEPGTEPVPMGILPLSPGQRALWFLHRMDPESAAYSLAVAVRLRGPLDGALLARALGEVVGRHAALRTRIAGDEPVQEVLERVETPLHPQDARGWSDGELRARLAEEAHRPFRLDEAPLLRTRLFRRGEDDHVLLVAGHHAVLDFRSLEIVLDEVLRAYLAPATLPQARFQYPHFVRWQEEALAGPQGERLREACVERLRGAPAVLALPTDRPRPPVRRGRGGAHPFAVDAPVAGRLRELARREGTTPYTLLLAAWQLLLWRYSGQEDFLVGSPASGRTRPSLADVVGYLVNPVVLRARVDPGAPFRALLAAQRAEVLGALSAQAYPLPLLVEQLRPERGADRTPLFQAMFVLQQAARLPCATACALGLEGVREERGPLVLEPVAIPQTTAQFDLVLEMGESHGVLAGLLRYDADLFEPETARRMAGHFVRLLEGIAADPETPAGGLDLLGAAEREEVLTGFNRTGTVYPDADLPLHRLVEAQARRAPDAVAAVFEGESLSYGELDRCADELASALRARGVGPEVRVGVRMERSLELVVALLGVLKAGGAYVPMDPEYPAERLEYMRADSEVAAVVGNGEVEAADALSRSRPVAPPHPLSPDTEGLAYVIYTSGSTGRPKGAMNTHRGVVNRLLWMQSEYGLTPGDAVLQKTPFSFDVSVWELFWPLIAGARLVLARPGGHRDPTYLRALIEAERITTVHFVPSMLHAFLEAGAGGPIALRRVVCSGETLPPELKERFFERFPGVELHNLYGPTEAAVDVTHWACAPADGRRSVPIGRPVANTRVYVLDARLAPLPVGVPGELYLGGVQLGRGYLGRADLTAERFLPDGVSGEPGARLYRTGDLTRWLPGGVLEYLGRVDSQVKVRGFRIEPGEVESVLSQHPGVRECAVAAWEPVPGETRLAAYVVPRGPAPEPAELREHLRRSLPDPVVPSTFATLEALPLTPSGKLDRRALPRPEAGRGGTRAEYVAPRNEVEAALAGIWAEVLGLAPERVGVRDGFFELGGHSLLAVRVASWVQRELGVTLPLHALFQSPTVESLALRLAEEQLRAQAPDRGDGAAPAPGIPRRIPGERCPLSFSQQRLWFVDRYEPGSAAYHALSVVRFDGALDVEALRSALDGVVARHEALRTVFAERGGEAEQVVLPPLRVPFRVEDLGAPAAGEVEEEVERRVRREARLPFDLTEGPLVRAVLLRTAADRHHLVLTLHHIAGDAWSRGILVREVSALYGARVRGEEPQLPEPPIQYPDYAAWQRARLRGPLLREQLDWWTERLRGAPPVLELPADRPRPPVHPVEGALHRFRVPAPAVEALRRLAREEEATPFLVLLAAFKVFLARYTGETDLVVGTPVANRGRAETEGVVGFFANTLALRTDLAGDPPFRELLRRVRETALGAYAHEELPFERLVEELRPERDLSRPVVFQTMFVLDGDPPRPLCLPGVEMVPVDSHPGTSPFDLTLRMEDGAAGLAGGLEYATALFDAATAARMAEHFVTLLEGIASGPDARISRLPLMSAAERRRVLAEWNDTGRPYPAGDCVHDLFARQAARTPDATALVFRGETLSYAELDRRVNRLANGLRARGVGPETRVGVCLERTPELVVALLAVLKAGGAYVPLDPAHPAERLGYVVEDAGVRLVLTTSALAGRLPRGAVVPVLLDVAAERAAAQADGAPESGATPENLSHVIFTSGSTGRPKGVMIRHSSVVVLLHWLRENVSDEERSAVLFSTSVGFDVSVAEVLGTLAWGGKLVLVENALELASVEEAVVYASMVPTAAAELLRAGGIPRSVRTLNLGGEALPGDLAQALYASGVERVGNLYGPTEDTTYSTYSLVERGGSRVTVGQPVANTRAYVLDGRLEPVPVGVVGELYLAGDGLARGYASRPDLTAGRFLPNPFGPAGSRMYRVMDRVRWRADGELEYFGRTDFQVKVRGFRIELGEIEATLLRHPGVHEAVAVVREDRPGDRRIVAYLAAAEGSAVPPAAELRAQLRERLPEYMVPSAFVVLAALPRTPSGKLDRRALPPPDASAGAAYVAPCTPTEEALAGIWAEALGVARVGAGESFFDLGGHSLLGTRVVSRVRDDLGVEVPLRVLFEAPVLAEFAERVDALRPAGDGASGAPRPDVIRPRETDGPVPLSFAQQRLWFIHQLQPGSAAYNLSAAFRIRGPLDVEALRRALEEVVRRHEALRTTFSSVAGRAAQVIHPAGGFRLPMLDLGGLEGEEREAELRLRVGAEESTPFDLATGPLLRVLLIRLGEREHALLLTLHHIVSDGWSTEVMVRELAELYGAFREGRPSPLPPLPVQYADYAVWQRSWLAGETLERQLAWWRDLLAGAPPLLELPTDCPRPRVPGTEGGSRPLALPAELADELRAFSRREGATPFMTLMAAWQVLLGRHAGQTDVVVGMPIAGRNRVETEGLIGFFVNTLAIRTDFSGGPDSRALLHRVRETMLGAHQHQDLPFEKLVEELGVERSLGHTPLFQAVLAPHRAEGPGPRLAGVELEPIHAVGSTAKFDLTLSLTDDGEGLRGALGFRAELFDVPTVDRLLGHFVILLQGMATSPETPVAELPLLAEWERDRVLTGWNTTGEAPAGRCIHPLVEEAVRAAPEAVAVSWRGARVTYAELDARAGRLANRLRALGVGPEARVGVCLERTPELVVALLAVLRAGGAYVPLDPDYPVERLLYLLDDAGARVLVTEAALAEGLARPRMAVVRVDADREAIAGESPEAPESGVRPENLAYVLYTSGSTGTPKGVMVDHAALAAHVVTIRGAYGITSADRVLHFAAAVFDPALEQLLTALVCGATVVLRPQELWSPAELRRHLAEESVTVANLPTAYWRQAAAGWAAAGPFPPLRLRLMIAGGERMPPEAATLWRRGPLGEVRLLNAYGPTEATVTATLHEVPRGDPAPSGRVPIGRALPGRRAYVLDGAGAPVPVGVPGELHLGGASLARGYLGRPELTAEAFVPDPWGGEAGARLYRTGDRVRWLPTGELEYLGRADVQVKVRGFRIEPGEVEAALRAHPAVGDATVVARDDTPGGQRLVAYLTPAPGTAAPPAAELRAHLRAGLPEHMVPGAFVVLEALPTTPSGKVDRGALPVPEGRPEGEEYVPPCTPTERVVAAVWAETLGIERVGAHDNFFDLGGHSLLLVQMHARLQERLRTGVSVAKLFQFRTLADLARHLDDSREPAAGSREETVGRAGDRRSRMAAQRALRSEAGFRPREEDEPDCEDSGDEPRG